MAECSETGENGKRNGSQEKMEAMREEIAKNHGIDLSVERIRKLRKVASAYEAGRRRPGVSLEGHLEAGNPAALEELTKNVPQGTALTRDYLRQLKHPNEKAEQDQQKAERRQQVDHQVVALQNLYKQVERERDELVREKEEREQKFTDPGASVGKEPEPLAPPLAPADQPELTVGEDLTQALRLLLLSRGFDPAADNIKQALADFVQAVMAQQP